MFRFKIAIHVQPWKTSRRMISIDPAKSALDKLPHGPEFRFVDCMLELDPGVRGVGLYTVRGDEAFLRGHFPGEPMMPGVLIIEAVAQLAGVVAQCDRRQPPLDGLKLTAVRAIKILGTARPGECITLQAKVLARMGALLQARVDATVGNRVLLEGEITLAGMMPK